MSGLVGNSIEGGTGAENKYRGSGHKRRTLRVIGGAAVIAVVAAVAGCEGSAGTTSAANTASSSASATKPNAQLTTGNAYATAVTDIGKLVTACVGLGSKATTVKGGTPGAPTTQRFYDKYEVTATEGLTTTPSVEKAQCDTGDGSISGHNATGQRWTMAEDKDTQGNPRVIVEHADGTHVVGTSAIQPGSTDISPVDQAYTFLDGLMAGATAAP